MQIKYRKCVNIVLHELNTRIQMKDIPFLLKIIFYYIKNKKSKDELVKILKFYNINYDYFIDLIRLNKDIVTLLRKEDKEQMMELLNN